MRNGWEEKMLKEIGIAQTGTTPKTVDKGNYGNYIPFIKPADIDIEGDGDVRYDNEGLSQQGLKSARKIQRDSILMVCIGATIGKVGIVDRDVSCNQQINTLTLKKDFHPKLFYYALSSDTFFDKVINNSAQATLPIINKGKWESLTVCYPKSYGEQNRIVEILDETFAAIDKAKANIEKNLQNAKELFETYLQNVFANKGEDWEEKRLAEIAITFGRGKSKHRPRNDEKLYGGKYPFIQTGDVRNSNKHITTYTQTYNEVGLAQSKLWRKGTICITIAANIAETGILDFDSCFPDSLIGLVVDPLKADVEYTYYALQSLKTELKLLGKGSAQDNINIGTFENQFFPFPSLKKQKQIAELFNSLFTETKKLEAIYQQKLNDLEDLKKSILQKAFNGELTAKEVV